MTRNASNKVLPCITYIKRSSLFDGIIVHHIQMLQDFAINRLPASGIVLKGEI